MLHHGNVPVQKLQHEIVDALQSAAGGGIGGIAGEFFELVVDPADHPVGPAVDHRMGRTDQHRRHEFLVEDDRLVANFEDSRDAERNVARLLRFSQLEIQPRIGDIDAFLDAQRRGRVDEGFRSDDGSGSCSPPILSSTSRVFGAATGSDSQTICAAAVSGTSMGSGRGLSPGMSNGVPSGMTPAARRTENLLCWVRSWSISR